MIVIGLDSFEPMPQVFRGQTPQERRKKIKRVMVVLMVLFAFSISAFAQMSPGRGGGMMGGGWGWGMNSGWFKRWSPRLGQVGSEFKVERVEIHAAASGSVVAGNPVLGFWKYASSGVR
ncbi:MAG TPA: hypothetical protein VF496_02165, partial [Candidatus Deferrimicrobium sp.]